MNGYVGFCVKGQGCCYRSHSSANVVFLQPVALTPMLVSFFSVVGDLNGRGGKVLGGWQTLEVSLNPL